MLFPLLFDFIYISRADELVQIQVIYRHGDRTPLECFPTDPNLAVWQAEPTGELTTIGMRQHFNQGLKMKARYVDGLKFINSTYRREEIYMLDPGHQCARDDTLTTDRLDNKQFVDYELGFAPMIAEIADLSGEGILDVTGLINFYDCVRIEKEFRNMTLAKWITPKLYNELEGMYWRTDNFVHGLADFGVGDERELIRVRGGALLTEILTRMQAAVNGTDKTKMFVYSGHDTTLISLWSSLGAKTAMSGEKNPSYASHYVLELWRNGAQFYIKAMYLADETSDFETKTSAIRGCGGGKTCPFEQLKQISQPFLVKNINELCDKFL